ncbi:hypothetical protein HK405_006796, partial [Cladochytrium tenue]
MARWSYPTPLERPMEEFFFEGGFFGIEDDDVAGGNAEGSSRPNGEALEDGGSATARPPESATTWGSSMSTSHTFVPAQTDPSLQETFESFALTDAGGGGPPADTGAGASRDDLDPAGLLLPLDFTLFDGDLAASSPAFASLYQQFPGSAGNLTSPNPGLHAYSTDMPLLLPLPLLQSPPPHPASPLVTLTAADLASLVEAATSVAAASALVPLPVPARALPAAVSPPLPYLSPGPPASPERSASAVLGGAVEPAPEVASLEDDNDSGGEGGESRPTRRPAHMATHNPSRDRPFACGSCGLTFMRIHDLQRHAVIHLPQRGFVCPNCHKGFARSVDSDSGRDRPSRLNVDAAGSLRPRTAPADAGPPRGVAPVDRLLRKITSAHLPTARTATTAAAAKAGLGQNGRPPSSSASSSRRAAFDARARQYPRTLRRLDAAREIEEEIDRRVSLEVTGLTERQVRAIERVVTHNVEQMRLHRALAGVPQKKPPYMAGQLKPTARSTGRSITNIDASGTALRSSSTLTDSLMDSESSISSCQTFDQGLEFASFPVEPHRFHADADSSGAAVGRRKSLGKVDPALRYGKLANPPEPHDPASARRASEGGGDTAGNELKKILRDLHGWIQGVFINLQEEASAIERRHGSERSISVARHRPDGGRHSRHPSAIGQLSAQPTSPHPSSPDKLSPDAAMHLVVPTASRSHSVARRNAAAAAARGSSVSPSVVVELDDLLSLDPLRPTAELLQPLRASTVVASAPDEANSPAGTGGDTRNATSLAVEVEKLPPEAMVSRLKLHGIVAAEHEAVDVLENRRLEE